MTYFDSSPQIPLNRPNGHLKPRQGLKHGPAQGPKQGLKKKQDLRVDLPTIGLKTLKQSKKAGLKGIVVKSKQHVFLDKNKCISFANKNNMFISVK